MSHMFYFVADILHHCYLMIPTDTQTHTQRHTHTQTDRQTDREKDKETDRQTDRPKQEEKADTATKRETHTVQQRML